MSDEMPDRLFVRDDRPSWPKPAWKQERPDTHEYLHERVCAQYAESMREQEFELDALRVRALTLQSELESLRARVKEQEELLQRLWLALDEMPNSPTWPYVLAFALEMEKKLALNRHKGDREGWSKESAAWLLGRLKEELSELESRLNWRPCGCRGLADCFHWGQNPDSVESEAADVANFAMMIADVAGDLKPADLHDTLVAENAELRRLCEAVAWAGPGSATQSAAMNDLRSFLARTKPGSQG